MVPGFETNLLSHALQSGTHITLMHSLFSSSTTDMFYRLASRSICPRPCTSRMKGSEFVIWDRCRRRILAWPSNEPLRFLASLFCRRRRRSPWLRRSRVLTTRRKRSLLAINDQVCSFLLSMMLIPGFALRFGLSCSFSGHIATGFVFSFTTS